MPKRPTFPETKEMTVHKVLNEYPGRRDVERIVLVVDVNDDVRWQFQTRYGRSWQDDHYEPTDPFDAQAHDDALSRLMRKIG